jgi:hypothetical protein
MAFIKTTKQIEAVELIKSCKTSLLEGGSRSGKTAIYIYSQFVRAYHYPNSWHISLRLRLSHARQSLWQKTIPEVARAIGVYQDIKWNNYDLTADLPNGSKLMVGGLDDKDRVEKILGNEYATIFLNEASQIDFDSYETVTTRSNPPPGVPIRINIDYNPPSQRHWGYQIFHLRKYPDGRPVPDTDYRWMKMNPADNIKNIHPDYIAGLQNLSVARRKRFLEGEYGTDEGTLWKREWIKYGPAPATLIRVVVGVDPSGSTLGDEIGIIVAGIDENRKVWILDDYSLHGSPQEWSAEVVAGYARYLADTIAAEKNFGGDMVEAVITQFGARTVNVKLVTASRGKAVRAEPISAMYERGEVVHAKQMPALEDEMCSYRPDQDESPNRMDAMVWAVTELVGDGVGLNYV